MTTTPRQAPVAPSEPGFAATRPRSVARSPVPSLRDLRPTRAPAATTAAMLLLVVGALTATEIALALTGRPALLVPRQRLAAEIAAAQWGDPVVLVAAGVAAAVGLLLLALAVIPGHARAIVLACDAPDVVLTISRRAARQLLTRDAARVEGVTRVRVALRRHRAVVRVSGRSRVDPHAAAAVERVITERIERLKPIRPSRVQVRVRWREARR